MFLNSARRRLLLLPALAALATLAGCNTIVMNAAGDVARQQGTLIWISVGLMLLIIVPVMFLVVLFAWKYRKTANAVYQPDWDHSTRLELLIWGAPLLIIIALGLVTWISTHKLDPYRALDRIDAQRPIAPGTEPLTVQVVAMDWKWLFIYPQQGIASVNELVTPIDTPIRFKLTSTTMMNSFYIPALAGQIYAMPGMDTTLNAVMNKVGVYDGFSANYSGAGFSHMRFKYHGVSNEEFAAWVQKNKAGNSKLDGDAYLALAKPSEKEPVQHFASVTPKLYDAVVNQCVAEGTMCLDKVAALDRQRNRAAYAFKNIITDDGARCVVRAEDDSVTARATKLN